jgi:hypothetical protein
MQSSQKRFGDLDVRPQAARVKVEVPTEGVFEGLLIQPAQLLKWHNAAWAVEDPGPSVKLFAYPLIARLVQIHQSQFRGRMLSLPR